MSLGRIFITGASGFLGRHLISYLFQSYRDSEIIGADLHEPYSEFPAKFIKFDITDYDTAKEIIDRIQPHTIFHLAGTFNQKDLIHLYKINVIGTENLIKAVTFLSEPTTIILSSSAAVYGLLKSENNPVKENLKVNPVSHYGISKVAMEMIGNIYAQRQSHLEIIIARAFNLIGPGLSSLLLPGYLTEEVRKVLKINKKKIIRVGNINPYRDFLDVRDAVKAYISLALRGEKNNIYNVGSGIGTKIKDLVDLFVKSVDSDIQIISDPALYKEDDPEIIVADISKIQKRTGWKPQIDLKKSVQAIISHLATK